MKKTPDTPISSSGMEIPDYAFESIARSLLPIIQKYYESDEGKQALAEWEKLHGADTLNK